MRRIPDGTIISASGPNGPNGSNGADRARISSVIPTIPRILGKPGDCCNVSIALSFEDISKLYAAACVCVFVSLYIGIAYLAISRAYSKAMAREEGNINRGCDPIYMSDYS